MKLLLDTHVVIWSLTNDVHLSPDAREMLTSAENLIFVSVASLWEIAIKRQKNFHLCPYHETDIKQYCEQSGYEFIPIRPEHVLCLEELKIREGHTLSNHDPFDRILLAQAKSEKARFLSHDQVFTHYDEHCIYMI